MPSVASNPSPVFNSRDCDGHTLRYCIICTFNFVPSDLARPSPSRSKNAQSAASSKNICSLNGYGTIGDSLGSCETASLKH